MRIFTQIKSRGRRAALGVTLGLSLGALSACDSLLEVELPHLLTGEALESETTAALQVNSAISSFECGYSVFTWVSMSAEDIAEAISGGSAAGGDGWSYRSSPSTGGSCDLTAENQSYFHQFMGARSALSRADGQGVYDRMQDEWSLGVEGERLSAIAAIYMAAIYDYFGEFYCEMAFDGGPLVTPDAALVTAESWVAKAIGHIAGAGGDFEMPNGISDSATDMAIALRARIRWARGDLAGAATDAATLSQGFNAWVTREDGPGRRNKVHNSGFLTGLHDTYGLNDWWNPAVRPDKPGGGKWADPIPFTGYLDLAIQNDGRAVTAAGYAITTADANTVPDTRVVTILKSAQGPGLRELPKKYDSNADDMYLVTWREMRLIQAEYQNSLGNSGAAIALVDEIRTAAGLPLVTYIGGGATATEIRYLIIEERRRSFFAEGRYLSTKIQNTDLLWFPRNQGQTPQQGYNLNGGVRLLFVNGEYTLNENFLNLDQRGTGCDPDQAPVIS